MSDKMRDDAIREAARNAAVDDYFKARPQLMRTRHEECLVEAGFDRGWQAAQSVPVVVEPVQDAIVTKYERLIPAGAYTLAEGIRAALTELAAEHDRKQALLLEAHCDRVGSLQERIRQLEAERVPEAILEIGRRMIADTKDNFHYTAHPMFRVEKRRIVTGIDTDYTDNIAWIDEDGEIIDPEEAATLEAAYDQTGEVPDSYTRTGFVEEWEHVDTYLTQQAAEARINSGKDGRVNVGSAYRNKEMRAVREFLMSLAAAQQPKEKE